MPNHPAMHDERAQHTIHRLEAFSDIVIGFCLAQLGLSLVLPKSATDMTSVWVSLTFFISAFTFIAVLWWLHHRTFNAFFVLNVPMVAINFAMLCTLVLTLYFLDGIVRVNALGQNPAIFFSLFVFSFALVYALAGAMLLTGLILRRAVLPPAEIRWAIGQLSSIGMSILFGIGAATYVALRSHSAGIGYAVISAMITLAVARRILVRRWLDRRLRDA